MAKRRRKIFKKSRYLVASFIVLVLTLGIGVLIFRNIIVTYKDNVALESAKHLIEINYQVKLYIEENIQQDWEIVSSIASNIENYDGGNQIPTGAMARERKTWNLTDIYIYTEDGGCINPENNSMRNDRSSAIVYYAREQGKYVTIVESTLCYTVPVETQMQINGSRVVAVSIVKNLETFMDNMEFSSFEGLAYMYLTQKNGAVISCMTNEGAHTVYNVTALYEGYENIQLIGGNRNGDLLETNTVSAHLLVNGQSKQYVITTPVSPDNLDLRLFYFVPERAVNSTMTGFSTSITVFSAILVTVLILSIMVIFLIMYYLRKREFKGNIVSRDRMFELLTKRTDNAFGMFDVTNATPLYLSENAPLVIGCEKLSFLEIDGKLSFKTYGGVEPDAFVKTNKKLEKWDRKSIFVGDVFPRIRGGETKFIQTTVYPLDSSPNEFICVVSDVTRAREHEDALKTALVIANRANESKNVFVSRLSHDIRIPINSIINMTDFAVDSVDNLENHLEYLKTIRESSAYLLQLVNDVIDMERIESGRANVVEARFELCQMIGDICEIVKPMYIARKQSFTCNHMGIQIMELMGDKLKLAQIILNIIDNAIKYTPNGGSISFTILELQGQKDGRTMIRFSVQDNGIGISADSIKYIFEPYVREDNSWVAKVEGTGLGLSISEAYVKLMGGTIDCASKPGMGSVFTVEIPFKIAEHDSNALIAEKHGSAAESFDGLHALLCEDNEINRRIARKLLESLGFAVDEAVNGKEGVDLFMSSEPGFYSIIYMDIQMPVMDGYTATTEIRESKHLQAKTIPIVAMTADVFEEDIKKAFSVGMDGHIGKPINVKMLFSETEKVLKIGG